MRKFNRGEPIGKPKRVLIGNETPENMRRLRLVFLTSFLSLVALQCKAEELYGAPPPDIDARIEGLVKAYPD
jgi:hypothetical protein